MKSYHVIAVLLLLLLQVIIWGYLNLSQYVVLTFMPAMVMCIPVRFRTLPAVLMAFFLGILVDLFTGGVIGITSAALMPVAWLRHPIIRLVFGEEVFSRRENISFRRQGIMKMTFGIAISTVIFMALFIWMDSAGARPFSFCIIRFICSTIPSILLSEWVAEILTREDTDKWR